jgi:hypothetical protein
MKVGTYTDGRDLVYEESTAAFAVGDAPVTTEQVLGYDSAGQITWESDEIRAWAQALRTPAAPPQPATPAKDGTEPQAAGWFTRLPLWAKILFVIFYPVSIPYGIWAMWKNRSFTQPVRIALTAVGTISLMLFLVNVASGDASRDVTSGSVPSSKPAVSQPVETQAEPEPAPAPEPTPVVEEPVVEAPSEPALTMGQQQAIAKGEDYLGYAAFSRKGLIDQLVFEGFSTTDATFAVDYIAPDWKAQAALKAQDYMDYSSFSRQGLIDQLVFEGFTKTQAEYGAESVGY